MTENTPYTLGFFLIPNFSMLSFAALLEPLRMANRMSGQTLFKWHLLTPDDKPVNASNDLPFTPTLRQQEFQSIDLMLVVAGIGAHTAGTPAILNWLKSVSRRGVHLGSTSTGSVLLAKAGLLNNKTCTVHWESASSLAEEFPSVNVSSELYEFDRHTPTCSGGIAGLDMMLHLINNLHGQVLAQQVAEQCIHPAIRPAHDKQRMTLLRKHNIRHPRLLNAVSIMESSIEEPMRCEEIGNKVGLSVRQLERLFSQHLNETPANYYLNLRLERAQQLLLQTALSITQVSTACGFSSNSYFSRCYRKRFQRTPRQEQQRVEGA